jgi:hypothetical protein
MNESQNEDIIRFLIMNPFTKKLIFFMLNHVNSRSHIIEIHQHGFFFLELTTNLLMSM